MSPVDVQLGDGIVISQCVIAVYLAKPRWLLCCFAKSLKSGGLLYCNHSTDATSSDATWQTPLAIHWHSLLSSFMLLSSLVLHIPRVNTWLSLLLSCVLRCFSVWPPACLDTNTCAIVHNDFTAFSVQPTDWFIIQLDCFKLMQPRAACWSTAQPTALNLRLFNMTSHETDMDLLVARTQATHIEDTPNSVNALSSHASDAASTVPVERPLGLRRVKVSTSPFVMHHALQRRSSETCKADCLIDHHLIRHTFDTCTTMSLIVCISCLICLAREGFHCRGRRWGRRESRSDEALRSSNLPPTKSHPSVYSSINQSVIQPQSLAQFSSPWDGRSLFCDAL